MPIPIALDYRRNAISVVHVNALSSQLLDLPLDDGPAAVGDWLKRRGIDHVLWQYRGFAVRSPGEFLRDLASPLARENARGRYSLVFFQTVQALAERSEILLNDGVAVLFRLQ